MSLDPSAPTSTESHDHCCSGGCGTEPLTVVPAPSFAGSTTYRIATMDCPVEENEIRRALEPVAGIRGLRFQLAARTLAIRGDHDVQSAALAAIRKAGFDPKLHTPGGTAPTGEPVRHAHAHADHGHAHDHDHSDHTPDAAATSPIRLAAALILALAAEALHFLAPETVWLKALGLTVAALAIGLSGIDTYLKGFGALRRGRLNISALMTVAVTGAFVIGQWPEAAMVMALYAIAELIEARAADRARNAIEGLLALAPEAADVLQADGQWLTTASAGVPIDSVVRLRPGARVPLDGVVTRGQSTIDQAPVTGESLPADKAVGDPVFAGTINQAGELQFRVTAAASDTTLARIIHAVEDAQGKRAPTQRFVDRFAAIYTPAVFLLAVAVALLTPWLLGFGWLDAVYKALVLLVVACPCALVISTPVTVVSALAAAARRGILIKGGTYLESARTLKAIALDKTGTVTTGKPSLVAWELLRPGVDAGALAASLASRSDHPVSQAIAAGLDGTRIAVDGFTALPGRGIEGRLAGQPLVLGNRLLVEERGLGTPDLEARLAEHEQQGLTVTLLADAAGAMALFAVADTIKPTSRDAVRELKALGVVPVMLTGDNTTTARAIAAQAGIDDVQGNLLPQDKQAAIQALQQRHGPTAMTGDGINDAPALAQADIGFAMGGAGTDIAMEAADVVIMNDNLGRLPETIRLSRRTHAVLWQNIALALGIKAVFMALALFGSATMWMAVFADMGATLIVVANGLRLLRTQAGPEV